MKNIGREIATRRRHSIERDTQIRDARYVQLENLTLACASIVQEPIYRELPITVVETNAKVGLLARASYCKDRMLVSQIISR
jgi:hypothetical protein